MKKFLLFLAVLAVVVVCIGFYRGWFSVSAEREAQSNVVGVNLSVDPDKVKADAETVKDKTMEITGQDNK